MTPHATKKVSVEIANPLAGDRPFLRRDIIPTLAQTVQRNLRRGVENVSLYEIGHVYLWDPNAPAIPALPGAVKPTDEQLAALDAGLPDQPMHVAGILTGNAVDSGWMAIAVPWTGPTQLKPCSVFPTASVQSSRWTSRRLRTYPRSGIRAVRHV